MFAVVVSCIFILSCWKMMYFYYRNIIALSWEPLCDPQSIDHIYTTQSSTKPLINHTVLCCQHRSSLIIIRHQYFSQLQCSKFNMRFRINLFNFYLFPLVFFYSLFCNTSELSRPRIIFFFF